MMTKFSYSGYRFPPEIIQQAIWLYVRFTLSFRDVEDLLAERGIVVSYRQPRMSSRTRGSKSGNGTLKVAIDLAGVSAIEAVSQRNVQSNSRASKTQIGETP
jgi:hypothetical protein